MNRISRESWEKLRVFVLRGETIPDFYVPFLTPERATDLLTLARSVRNTALLDQLRRHVSVAKKSNKTKKFTTEDKKKLRQKLAAENDRIAQRKKKEAARARFRKGRDTSLAALRPTVFNTDANLPFVYLGGSGAVPVQNDKSANLPSE